MNILIIEDDLFLANNIKKVFEKKVITNNITVISSFEDFIHELSIIKSYDIVLVDIKLKDSSHKNGLDIIQIIRKKKITIPIIVISGFADINFIEKAFLIGANDYITKPFRLKELELRIMKWFKSYCIHLIFSHSEIITYKKITYDFDTNDFYFKDQKLFLTKKSKFILFQLMIQSEKIISESFLKNKLWGDRELCKERNLRVNILRLKKSLKKYGIDKWIHNKRGEGYMLKKI